MSFGQFAATSQFYLYGRSHCTRTGWENAAKKYPKPDPLEDPSLNLSGKVYLITGANAGIGREITTFAASKGATVFMVCRNPSRAETARQEIMESTNSSKLHLLLGDCGLESDIRRIWEEFTAHPNGQRLDVLVCNAGALLNEKKLSQEGVEVTLATHLLFGTYLLTQLALPCLAKSSGRVLAVSSGGMYNTKFPPWHVATALHPLHKYDGQFAYAYAKRGQVLLMERLARSHPSLLFLSCHPGWTQTEAVDAAYGSSKSYLEPLRSTWQGAEGIIYLSIAPQESLESGGFYLDRAKQVKHMSGPFFSEGSFTKNTEKEVDEMVEQLGMWSSAATRPSLRAQQLITASYLPLQGLERGVALGAYMGAWHVLALIPTPFEQGAFNSMEQYALLERGEVDVKFTYLNNEKSSRRREMGMKAAPQGETKSTWALSPKVFGVPLPLGLSYLIVDVDDERREEEGEEREGGEGKGGEGKGGEGKRGEGKEERERKEEGEGKTDGKGESKQSGERGPYSYALVSMPDRAYLWVLTRERPANYPHTSTPIVSLYQLEEEAGAGTGTASGEGTGLGGLREGAGWEREVCRRAVKRAGELGIDVKKIIRAPWKDEAAGGK